MKQLEPDLIDCLKRSALHPDDKSFINNLLRAMREDKLGKSLVFMKDIAQNVLRDSNGRRWSIFTKDLFAVLSLKAGGSATGLLGCNIMAPSVKTAERSRKAVQTDDSEIPGIKKTHFDLVAKLILQGIEKSKQLLVLDATSAAISTATTVVPITDLGIRQPQPSETSTIAAASVATATRGCGSHPYFTCEDATSIIGCFRLTSDGRHIIGGCGSVSMREDGTIDHICDDTPYKIIHMECSREAYDEIIDWVKMQQIATNVYIWMVVPHEGGGAAYVISAELTCGRWSTTRVLEKQKAIKDMWNESGALERIGPLVGHHSDGDPRCFNAQYTTTLDHEVDGPGSQRVTLDFPGFPLSIRVKRGPDGRLLDIDFANYQDTKHNEKKLINVLDSSNRCLTICAYSVDYNMYKLVLGQLGTFADNTSWT